MCRNHPFLAGLAVMLAATFSATACRGVPESAYDQSTGDGSIVRSLARLVETSSTIVVGNYESIDGLGSVTLVTAEVPDEPDGETDLVGTEIRVTRVLKTDDGAGTDSLLTYTIYGTVPRTRTELAIDETAGFPHVWDVGTEFVLFLDREAGADTYYIPYGACGRVLTAGQVACSDGDRSVPAFMTGLDRDAFLSAVEAEIQRQSTNAPVPAP